MRFSLGVTALLITIGYSSEVRADYDFETIDEVCTFVDAIYVVSITEIQSYLVDRGGFRLIRSRTTASVERVGRGMSLDTITLDLAGGTIDEFSINTSSYPAFVVGGRYLYFLYERNELSDWRDQLRYVDEVSREVGRETGVPRRRSTIALISAIRLNPEVVLPSNEDIKSMVDSICDGSELLGGTTWSELWR